MQIDRPITIAIMIFAIILLVFVLVMPEYKIFTNLQTELSKKQAEFKAEYDYYATIARIYFDLQSRKSDVAKIDDALPQDSSLGKTIYFLQETAKENGMMVKDLYLSKSSLSSAGTSKGSTVKDIVFSMDLLGNYSSLGRFITAMEKSSRIFEVASISFGSANQPTSVSSQSQFQIQQTYSFSLQIKTHSY